MAINIELIGQILSKEKGDPMRVNQMKKKEIFFKKQLHVKLHRGRLVFKFLTQNIFSQAR